MVSSTVVCFFVPSSPLLRLFCLDDWFRVLSGVFSRCVGYGGRVTTVPPPSHGKLYVGGVCFVVLIKTRQTIKTAAAIGDGVADYVEACFERGG